MRPQKKRVLSACFVFWLGAWPADSGTIRINLGTEAPEGSIWHEILLEMGEEWKRISSDQVVLHIYPSGVQGDETEMLRKVQLGQLHAVGLSATGLSRIDRSVSCLQVPMLIESYEELDFIMERVAPRLEQTLLQHGYIVLNWSDVGWVHFFTKAPARTLREIRDMKLFTSAGDPVTEKLYKSLGFRPVPLAVTDLLPSLQTGLIDAMDVPPLLALLQQTFGLAAHMIPVKWAPVVGATILSRRVWEKIPEMGREEMLESARRATLSRRQEIRSMGDEAIEEMRKRGLQVVELDEATIDDWRREAKSAYPRMSDTIVPKELLDQVLRLSQEFDSAAPSDAKPISESPEASR